MMRLFWVLPFLVLLATGTKTAMAQVLDPMYSPEIVEEVISESKSPRAYDWRKNSYELQLGYGHLDEANNFENEVYEMVVGFPMSGGFMPRFGLRRVIVWGTESTDNLGRTPFTQESGMTRYEVVGGFGVSLLEGRNFTRLSPGLGDFENVVMGWAGLHYSHPNATYIPKKNEKPKKLPGQKPVNQKLVLELGLRWMLYTPRNYGIYLETMYHRAGGTGDLRGWRYFAGGIAVAFD